MIKVNFKEVKKNSKDLSEHITILAANASAEEFTKSVKEQTNNLKCDNHPNNTKGIIDVKADIKKVIVIDKHSFCCDEMKDSISISVK